MLRHKITAAMHNRGITTAQLAANTEMSESTIKRIISGTTTDPGVQTLQAISAVLDVPLLWLIDDTMDETDIPSGASLHPQDIGQRCKFAPQEVKNAPAESKFAPQGVKNDPLEIENESQENEDMNQNLTVFLDALKESHREKVEILNNALRQKDRWINILAAAIGVLILGLILWLGYDITHPLVGWVQY